MILPEVRNSRGQCVSGISYTDGFPYILGDVFMQNLVTVFDLSEKMEVRYAERVL
jgi:aspergillopepsin I